MATIYEELGGEPAVDAAVDIFYRKVLADERISRFFDDIDMDVHPIGDHPHVIIVPTSHRLVRKSRIPLSDLADETFLTREPGSGTRMIAERLFARHGLEPLVGMELGSNEAIRETMLT